MREEFQIQRDPNLWGWHTLIGGIAAEHFIGGVLEPKGIIFVHRNTTTGSLAFFEAAFQIKSTSSKVSVLAGSYKFFLGRKGYIPTVVGVGDIRLPVKTEVVFYNNVEGI